MRLNPQGCFIAYDEIAKLGVTTTTVYGRKLGWIGNVIVDKHYRGRNIGHTLVEHAVTHLQKARVQHIALYCYLEHVKFYEDLGFARDKPFIRMRRSTVKRELLETSNTFVHPPPVSKVLAADKRAFGADRSKLIHAILAEKIGWILGSSRRASSASYLIVKEYGKECELGPWICTDPSRDDPNEMMSRALNKIGSVPVEVSCMRGNWKAVKVLKANHFRTVRTGYRMFFNETAHLGDDEEQFALGFLDKG
jgi:hypothetical protein